MVCIESELINLFEFNERFIWTYLYMETVLVLTSHTDSFWFSEKFDDSSEDKSVFDRILAVNMKAGMWTDITSGVW